LYTIICQGLPNLVAGMLELKKVHCWVFAGSRESRPMIARSLPLTFEFHRCCAGFNQGLERPIASPRHLWAVCELAILVGLLSVPGRINAADDKPAAKPKEEKKAWIPDRREFGGRIARIDTERRIVSLDTQLRTGPIVYQTRGGSGWRGGSSKTIPIGDLSVADDVKVRLPSPPPATDEKGNPKKYTAKELKALKGPGNEWGYSADFDSLKPGQTVRFYLKWPKPSAQQPSRPAGSKKDPSTVDTPQPVIATIHILVQPPEQ
jgi:hypothetical protein